MNTLNNRPSQAVRQVAIIGAGIGGLMSALALCRQGVQVTVYERDPAPAAGVAPANSWDWLRKGVPQSVHPHFFMGRLRVLLEKEYPELVQKLMAAGTSESDVQDYVHTDFAGRLPPSPGDARLRTLNCRRTTFEMMVREYAETLPNLAFRNGVQVSGLRTHGSKPAEVSGIVLEDHRDGDFIPADAVIDASGRFSKLAKSLRGQGVTMLEDQRDSGIWYLTRHYRIKPGHTYPDVFGLPGAQFADFTVGALPADNGYFTVTFQVYREDKALAAALRDPQHFQKICAATSQVAPWVDPARSEPAGKVYGFGQMDSYWRNTVINGTPSVLNYYCVGDSCVRSNPKYGRGCTWSTLAAHKLSSLLLDNLSAADRIRAYESWLEREFRHDWRTMRNIDRSTERAFAVAAGKLHAGPLMKIGQSMQSFVNEAIVTEPGLFRDLWTGYNGFQHMSSWTFKPVNWLRLARAWLTRRRHTQLLQSQRGRATHAEMVDSTAS